MRAAFAVKPRISDGLAPDSLQGAGLAAWLEAMAREFVQGSGSIRLSTDLNKVATDESTQLAIFRMVQESLTNIAKYAAADAAEMLVRNRGDTITVAVRDNGQGFNAAPARVRGHGLRPTGTDL